MQLSEGISKYQQLKKEIRRYSSQDSAHQSAHPKDLIVNLMELQAIAKTPAK
jgi:hypothetical protein